MGNIYSLVDLKNDEETKKIIHAEIIKLEQNIKKIETTISQLNNKCDTIMIKLVEIDNKTYELVKTSNTTIIEDASEWDYYDLNQNIDLSKVTYTNVLKEKRD